jgi:asparagine synthase (glutamine-hydrolysing)
MSIRSALLDSVRHHLVADVPVSAFLSSGVDSGALVGLMRDAEQQHIKTTTVMFDEFKGTEDDESPLAGEIARTYDTDHHVYRVTRSEFKHDLPLVLEAMDQPSIDGINTWFVAKAAAAQGVKVALSGLGGDELFGGYPSFQDIPRWVRWLALPSRIPGAAPLFRVLSRPLQRRGNPKIPGLLEYGGSYAGAWFLRRGLFMPWDLEGLMDEHTLEEGLRRLRLRQRIESVLEPDPGTPFARVSALESSLYMRNQLLRDTDWASMAHSLEVRVPYVDPVLLHVCATSRRPNKAAIAASPQKSLPAAVTLRPKTGFQTPVAQWLQQEQGLGAWRRVPRLNNPSCPWARRWSHVIGSLFARPVAAES